MRKLKLFLSMLMLIAFSVGNVWADDPASQGATLFSEDFSSYSATDVPSGTVTTTTGRVVYGNANVTYACTNGESGSATAIYADALATGTTPEIMIGKYGSGGSTGGSFSVTGIPSGGAQEITVSFKQNKQKLKVAVAGTGYTSDGVDAKPASAGTVSFDITVGDGAASTFDLTFSVYSSNVRVDDILVTVKTAGEGGAPAPTLTGVTVSGTPTKTSYYAGQDFDPAGLTVTGTYSDESTAPITSGITWSYDPSQALALNQTSIGVVATVSEIASPKFNVTGLTVTEAPAAVNYEKVTSAPADWSGEYILVYESGSNAYVYTGVDANNNYAAATISDDVIAIPEGAVTLTIASMEGGYSIRIGGGTNDGKYISGTSGTNTTKFGADPVANTLAITDGSAVITAGEAIAFNSGSATLRFRYYKPGQKAVQLYKKVDGAVKPSAELSYAASDQKKLTKLGDAFTAPELSNPHSVAVTYASNNTDVAEVASNGAVTIKAVGVATITASYDGSGDYKEGSASYTIGVTTHAGTEADPYVAADAKTVIDVMGTVENAYATGVVSNVVTTSLPAEGYITFYFSADGATTGQQIEAYKCYGLNSAAFEALSDVETGATVVVTGNLKKYNSTYEFDQNCHLVSYEAPSVPKTHIANDQANPYTVAQAITFAADGITYDLDDYVYVAGVVYDVKSFNTTNGTLDIYIKDAGQENQFELFKCAGINDGESTTPFEALTDVQEGDEVIAYGQLTVYNTMSELKQGNYLVELNRPEVAVESVSLPATETVEVGSTVTLTATVLPDNASNKSITWTVESGSDKASVDENGVVTGVAEGTAVIRATSVADGTKLAECTVTVVAADPTKHVVTFDATVDKTTEATELSITKGDLTIAVTEGDGRFNNGTDYRPYKNAVFTVSCSSGNITKIEFTCTSSKPITGFADLEGLDKANEVWTGNAPSVSFTASGAQVQMTQLVITYKEDNRAAAGLAWDPSDDIELTVGDAFTAPTLSNPNNIDAAEITIASDNTDLAVVNDGVVSLVEDATGEATITATFAGNDDYKPTVVSYTITVNAAAPTPLTDYYEKVTETAGIVEGTYLIVYEAGNVAFDGGLGTLDAENNTIDVEITNDNKIGVTQATTAATFYIDPTAGSIQAANGKYIGVGGNSNGLKTSDNADTYTHNFSIDGDENAVIAPNFEGSTMSLRYNAASNQARFRYYKDNGQQAIQLYKLANEAIKPAAGLAWDPADDIEITVGETFTAPTLLNPNSIDAGEITIESSNTDLATVTAGVVELVADATGTTTITATFAGNASYKPATVSYKIKVNPANSIYVSPGLNVNFGSVAKDAEVEDKVITVTLTGVDAATATLEGAGASAFEFTPAALTASGDITISASSATAGTFAATLTISDDAGLAASKVVNLSLTVTEPEIIDDLTGTWVLATAVPAIGDKFIVAGTYNNVTKTMGSQNTNNRVAVVSSLSEGVLTPGVGTKVFTLVDAGEDKYAIKASNNKYLTASGTGTKNYLTEAADYEAANAKWTISVDGEGAASVVASSSNRNQMQYNKSGDGLFSCYDGGQTAIQLFVLQAAPAQKYTVTYAANGGSGDAPEVVEYEEGETFSVAAANLFTAPEGKEFDKWNDGSNDYAPGDTYTVGTSDVVLTAYWKDAAPAPVYETVRSGLECGRHYTVCLENNVTDVKGATFWSLTYKNAASTEVYLVQENAPFAAGTPYIIQATGDNEGKLEVVYGEEVALSAGTSGALVGTFSYLNAEALNTINETGENKVYILFNNELRRIGSNNHLDAHRAYVLYNLLEEEPAQGFAPGKKVKRMPMQSQTTTDCELINAAEAPAKMMINGQLFILRGEKMYDTTGRLVK